MFEISINFYACYYIVVSVWSLILLWDMKHQSAITAALLQSHGRRPCRMLNHYFSCFERKLRLQATWVCTLQYMDTVNKCPASRSWVLRLLKIFWQFMPGPKGASLDGFKSSTLLIEFWCKRWQKGILVSQTKLSIFSQVLSVTCAICFLPYLWFHIWVLSTVFWFVTLS